MNTEKQSNGTGNLTKNQGTSSPPRGKIIRRAATCLLGAVLLTLPAAVQGQCFNYTINGGTITITGYTCTNSSVVIPSTINIGGTNLSVVSIGYAAFYGNKGLTSVAIPDSVTNIGDGAFESCGLTSVMIGTNVTSIGDSAFAFCFSLASATIPDSVTSIGAGAFESCGLTSVTIPNSVTNILESPFGGCSSLMAITVDTRNSVYSDLDGVLFNQSLTALIQYPAGIDGSYTIPDSVTNIGYGAFDGCPSLTSVTIPDSVTSIGGYAFNGCVILTNATIPNSVTSIGDHAFWQCYYRMTSVTIPASVTSIGEDPFGACYSLTAITVDAGNPVYSSLNGVLFDKNQDTLIQYPGGVGGGYTIPASVTHIADSAFERASLTSVTIPGSVVSIEDYAFYGSSLMTSVGFTSGLTSIGNYAFAFTGLTSVTMPNSVTSLGDYAFWYCSSLAGVYFQGNAPTPANDCSVFSGDNNTTVYYLPGTTGWGTTFDCIPAVLWHPQVQTSDGSFGVRTNQFGFNITWASGRVVVVEACTNLVNHTWSPVGTNTLTGGTSYFSDPQWTNYQKRFYRLVWQ